MMGRRGRRRRRRRIDEGSVTGKGRADLHSVVGFGLSADG